MATTFTEKQLAQAQFAGTPGTSAALYTVPATTIGIIKTLTVCNTGTVATTFRLYMDNAAAGAATSRAIYYDAPIGANATIIDSSFRVLQAAGVLRYDAGVASAVTFTVSGAEVAL